MLLSTKGLIATTDGLLLDEQRARNPITNRLAVLFKIMVPDSDLPDVTQMLEPYIQLYLTQLKDAAAKGTPLDIESGHLALDKYGKVLSAEWSVYYPEPGVTMELDEKGVPVMFSVWSDSELAKHFPQGDESWFSDKKWGFFIYKAGANGEVDKQRDYPDLVLVAAQPSELPEPPEQIEQVREKSFPLRKAIIWEIYRNRVEVYYSVRLKERNVGLIAANNGTISSTLDLRGANLWVLFGRTKLSRFTLCFFDLYAGLYKFPAPSEELNKPFKDAAEFRLTKTPVFIPGLSGMDEATIHQVPSCR